MDINESLTKSLGDIKRAFKGGSFGGRKTVVGLDIGNQSVKVVELEKSKKGIVLKNYALARTKENLLKAGASGVISQVTSDVIKKILAEAGIKERRVNVAVPGFTSLITVIDVPRSSGNVDQVVREEAPKYIPARLEDVVYGWEIIEAAPSSKLDGKSEEKKDLAGEEMKVLIVAIMKEISDQYQKVLLEAGLSVDSLEIESFSLVRSLVGNDRGCYLILDIGHKVCNMIVVSNGSLLVNRTIDIAGDKMTKVLGKGMRIDEKRAEQIKIKQGINAGSQSEGGILSTTLGLIMGEARKTTGVMERDYPGTRIDSVVLSGGCSRMVGLREYIEKELSIKTIIGNPLSRLSYPDKIKDIVTSYSPFFSVAVGLALLGFEEENK